MVEKITVAALQRYHAQGQVPGVAEGNRQGLFRVLTDDRARALAHLAVQLDDEFHGAANREIGMKSD